MASSKLNLTKQKKKLLLRNLWILSGIFTKQLWIIELKPLSVSQLADVSEQRLGEIIP